MARRRVKKRTHVGAKDGKTQADKTPKSMVIRIGAGEIGASASQLVKDMRQVMEPHTASRLKERKANKLRDYTTMCGPLGVSHLLLFSRSSSGNNNLRIAIAPRGPTLHFRIQNYALCKDVLQSMKHPKTGSKETYMNPPLLVMNNFNTQAASATDGESGGKRDQIPKHLESLITTVFQSLFPPITPQATPLHSIRRILLLDRVPKASPQSNGVDSSDADRQDGTYTLYLRHYHISTKATDLPRSIKRLHRAERAMTGDRSKNGRLPNLGKMEDVADYFLGDAGGYTSASDTEVETDAEVEVIQQPARKVLGRRERDEQRAARAANGEEAKGYTRDKGRVEKRAVKMTELGPRMKLRLTKVEDGLCGGKVLWHEFITKSKEEVKEMDAVWEKRNAERAERRRIQKENVERKKAEKAARGGKPGPEDEDEDDVEGMDLDDDEWDDDEYDGDDADADEGEDDGVEVEQEVEDDEMDEEDEEG